MELHIPRIPDYTHESEMLQILQNTVLKLTKNEKNWYAKVTDNQMVIYANISSSHKFNENNYSRQTPPT